MLRFLDTLGAFFREAEKWKRVEVFKFSISENQAFAGDRNSTLFKSEGQKLADSCGAQAIKLEFVVLTDRSTTHPDIFLECIADFVFIGALTLVTQSQKMTSNS